MGRIHVIDSHTEGEPTRVVLAGGPDLGGGGAAERLRALCERHDGFRSAIVNEPRGSDALVGALVLEPSSPAAAAQVLFFNNVGPLGMCVHGTIGVAVTLAHAGRLASGRHTFETPVGEVVTILGEDGTVAVENVRSHRLLAGVAVETRRHGVVRGDVAWGGNWFFLVGDHDRELSLENVETLTDYAWDVRTSLERAGVTGSDGAVIDHVELFGPPVREDADSRNFVLCPGRAYDRSPCGTGTSAKMACLAADGRLKPGDVWRQESIIGSLFRGTVEADGDGVLPTVSGRAWITAEADLLFAPDDPFRQGIRP